MEAFDTCDVRRALAKLLAASRLFRSSAASSFEAAFDTR
jgi:hypothetical protein